MNKAGEFSFSSDHFFISLICESRNIIRLLNENLVPGSSKNEIHHSNRSDIIHDTDALFSLLFDKVIEGEKPAVDLLAYFDINPKTNIQILRIMYALGAFLSGGLLVVALSPKRS